MTTPEQFLEQLEKAERAAPAANPEVQARIWTQVEARLDDGSAPPEIDGAPLLENAAPQLVGTKIVAAVVLVGVLGGLGWAGLSRSERATTPRSTSEDSALLERPDPVELTPASVELTPDPVELTPDPVELTPDPVEALSPQPVIATPAEPNTEDRVAPKESKQTAPKRAAPSTPKTLADELELMQALSTALKRGDSHRARALVAEHEDDFPDGQFIEEREAAAARALCQAGRAEAGRKRAQRFVARWPASIHRIAVESDCEKK